MSYKYIENIAVADIAFEAKGQSIEEMFVSAGLAVEEIMVDFKTLDEKESKHIKLSANNVKTLLHDFLEELVYLKDAEHLVFKDFKIGISVGTKCSLTCEAIGDKIDYKTQKLKLDIKAITHHMYEVTQQKNNWIARVVVDI